MAFISPKLLLSLYCILVVCNSVSSNVRDFNPWSRPLHNMLVNYRSILTESSKFKATKNNANFESFFSTMKEFTVASRQFKGSPLCETEVRNPIMESVARQDINKDPIKQGLTGLLDSDNVPEDNDLNRMMGTLLRLKTNLDSYLAERRRGDWYREFELDINAICRGTSVSESTENQLSVKDVCPDVDTCRQGSISDPNLRWLPFLSEACTGETKCDLNKAFPIMTAIFWYNVNKWMEKRICLQKCSLWNDHVHEEHMKLLDEAKILTAYSTIVPEFWESTWSNFFNRAVEQSAYTNLVTALEMVKEKEKFLNSTLIACNTLKFTDACPYADIFVEYRFIRKSQENRKNPSPVKDLRLYSDLDHAKMLELQRATSNHIELLGSIKRLDENLKVSVSGISSYFRGVARYDEGIADKDVQFINGEIDKFNVSLTSVVKEVKDNIQQVMNLVQGQMALTLATEVTNLALIVAENSNPFKLLFSGPDLDELADAANAIAEASVDVAHIAALIDAAKEVGENTKLIALELYNNQDQITGMQTLVEDIRANNMVSVRENADKFIEEYGAYTPQTNRSALEKNNALWSAFKDAACAMAEGDVGVLGAVSKGIVTGNLLCEKLDGSLAQFFTLREDMYDFQFQLVDAVAQVVRGSISQRLAADIKGKQDTLHASQLMIGFFMMQNKLQNVASAYCDIIEYERLGNSISACHVTEGLFTYENLDDLVSYEDKSPYAVVERDVYIPTRASFQGDTGYISLTALQTGDVVYFKLPANETWLRQNRWTLAGEENVPFLESLHIYLPRKEYLTGENREHTITQVSVTTNWGSAVKYSSTDQRTVYILPRGHSSYLTVYEEGYSSCPHEIDNPYSLCGNLPKLCDTSTRESEDSIIPTVLSTFKLQLSVIQGTSTAHWEAPATFTDLTLRARAKLRIPLSLRNIEKRPTTEEDTKVEEPQSDKPKPAVSSTKHKVPPPSKFGRFEKEPHLHKSHADKRNAHRPSFDVSQDGCCQHNKYRLSLENNRCADCPQSSRSKHGGLYCEITDA